LDHVIVMVLGEIQIEGSSRRFAQTFFLAYEDVKRYYVLNDIFRYLKTDEVYFLPFYFYFYFLFFFRK